MNYNGIKLNHSLCGTWAGLWTGLWTVMTLCSCAGPSTPLGAVWALNVASARRALASTLDGGGSDSLPRIRFTPSRQVLHGPAPVHVIIEDDRIDPHHYQIQVRYDDLDVTGSFLSRSKISVHSINGGPSNITIDHPAIRLSPSKDHRIEVSYRSASGKTAVARFEAPSCHAFEEAPVLRLGEFEPSPSLIHLIADVSRDYGFNSSFSTALVAQESAFDSHAVSWARALGLTQVTPLAEADVARQFSDWPRYPGLNDLPFPLLKAFILTEKINSNNEWRLDKERSIRGGLNYTLTLARRWSTPENMDVIRRLGSSDPEGERSRLILASYHSGYGRVFSAVNERGSDWLAGDDLSEARKYVNRVFSYCYAFSAPDSPDSPIAEVTHENAP
jgi:hypothetical protein